MVAGEDRLGARALSKARRSAIRPIRRGQTRRLSVAVILGLGALLAFNSAPALALKTHILSTTFTGSGVDALSSPSYVAVDNSEGPSAHDLYVTDPPNHRIEKFDSSGNFILMFGEGVDQSTGADVCTAASGDTCQGGTAGSSPGAFTDPTFVAVDSSAGPSSGDVYVGDTGDNTVSKFDPSGNLIASWASGGQLGGLSVVNGIAVDQSGDFYVLTETTQHYDESGTEINSFEPPRGTSAHGLAVDAEEHFYKLDGAPQVTKYDDTGENIDEPDGRADGVGLAIDPSTNDLYVVQSEEGGVVTHYALNCGQECAPLETFGGGDLAEPEGIGVDGSSGMVYVANTGAGNVAVFGTVILPDVITGPATNPGQTSATLTGHVDPAGGGNVTGCHFEYGTDTSYSLGSVPCSPPAPFSSPTDVSAEISALTSDTTYHYRLVATNTNGTNRGPDQTFTPHAVANLSTEAATNVTPTGARLNGSFLGNGEDTHYYFEWGTDTSYGNTTPAPPGADAGSGGGPTFESTDLTGLIPQTEYHYRIVASNSVGTSRGEDQSFVSLPAVAELKTEAATNVTPTGARLNGSFLGNSEDTHYYFEWGSTESFGSTTALPPGEDAGSGLGTIPVLADLSGLTPASSYYFRIVATNGVGTTTGNTETLLTPPAVPTLSGWVSEVHSDSALLNAEINPGGGATTYHFEYGTADCSTSSCTQIPAPEGSLEPGRSSQAVHVRLSGLTAGTEYHWRVVAENETGAAESADRTFTTFPYVAILEDPCPNAHVRQQTGAALLPDCRAYELVSAANTGGYDVESSLVPGQRPYGGYPQAREPTAASSTASTTAASPGIGAPDQPRPRPLHRDPRRRRLEDRIRRRPRQQPLLREPFSSIPSGADASLDTFAFGGAEGCSPCFEGGYTGHPRPPAKRRTVQGMAAPLNPGPSRQARRLHRQGPLRKRRTPDLRLDLAVCRQAATKAATSRSMTTT